MLNDHHGQGPPEVFVRHRDHLHALALQIVGTRNLAEDVLRIAYERILAAPGLGAAKSSYDYCVQIVRNLASLTLVRKSLDQLPSRTRRAFTLYRSEGLTKSQIADRLHVPPTQVDLMLADAVAALKSCRLKAGGTDPQP